MGKLKNFLREKIQFVKYVSKNPTKTYNNDTEFKEERNFSLYPCEGIWDSVIIAGLRTLIQIQTGKYGGCWTREVYTCCRNKGKMMRIEKK